MNNLPDTRDNTPVKKFFDHYLTKEVTFPAAEIDAAVAFFVKRGFDKISASSTAITILGQARAENVSAFTLIDSLKSLTDIQLSQVVAQVVNEYRSNTSLLGYRTAPVVDTYESRNILV